MIFVHFLLYVLFWVCLFNILYECFKLCVALYKVTEFKTTVSRRVMLCLSLAYIITVFLIGFPA